MYKGKLFYLTNSRQNVQSKVSQMKILYSFKSCLEFKNTLIQISKIAAKKTVLFNQKLLDQLIFSFPK